MEPRTRTGLAETANLSLVLVPTDLYSNPMNYVSTQSMNGVQLIAFFFPAKDQLHTVYNPHKMYN